MSKGGYHGGSTIVRAGSEWFSRAKETKDKDLGAGPTGPISPPPTDLERKAAAQLKNNLQVARQENLELSKQAAPTHMNLAEKIKKVRPGKRERLAWKLAAGEAKTAAKQNLNLENRETVEEQALRLEIRSRAKTRPQFVIEHKKAPPHRRKPPEAKE